MDQNPILRAKQVVNQLKACQNPKLMLEEMAKSDPQIAGVMQLINASGGNPQQAFYALAKQKGIDPNQVLSMLK